MTDILPDHPAFSRLSEKDRRRMTEAAELWEAPRGARLYYPGDSGEDLICLIEGRLESSGEDGVTRCWLPGDLWGEEQLDSPRPLEQTLSAAEPSRWLRWPRLKLLNMMNSSPHLMKSLLPVYGRDNRLISGLSCVLTAEGIGGNSGRVIRPSARPLLFGFLIAVLGGIVFYYFAVSADSVPVFAAFAAPAIFLGWALVYLLKRLLTVYAVGADSITSKYFDWNRFTVESRHVPTDRIQGVETVRKGLIRRILGIGTVIVKTSALDGELVLRDVNNPDDLGNNIREMRNTGSERVKGRDREGMRRTLEHSGLGGSVPLLLRGAAPKHEGKSRTLGEYRFRKSIFVLVGKLILPTLTGLIPFLGADVVIGLLPLSRAAVYSFSLLPILWALYRFEDWRNDSYVVSGGYAVDLYRKPLGLKESRRQVELASVQNIRTEQTGIVPFLFRYGNVILVTAGGAADTVFKHVSRPWKVQETLFRYREEDLRRREAAEREQRKDDLTRFAEAMDQIRGTS